MGRKLVATNRFAWQWLLMVLLIALVAVLAILQYRWIGQISGAERGAVRESLRSSLAGVSRDFDGALNEALAALMPSAEEVRKFGRELAYRRRYSHWAATGRETHIFSRVAFAWPEHGEARIVTLSGDRQPIPSWPERWTALRRWVESRSFLSFPGRSDAPGDFGPYVIDLPRFDTQADFPGEQDWLVAEVDSAYLGSSFLPQLLARYLGSDAGDLYRFEILINDRPPELIFSSDPNLPRIIKPVQSVPLLSVAAQTPPSTRRTRPGRPPRWELALQLREGSLDAIVETARRRNLLLSAVLLLLLLSACVALIRFSRQAQRFAAMQMEFVSNVSHELRTPLSVIRTAAFNLRGPLSSDAVRVDSYANLISQESERLTDIVEQILQFAASSSRLAGQRVPVAVGQLINESLQSSSSLIGSTGCHVETTIEPDVPSILGDPVFLRQALSNLIANAIKYGLGEQRWIGICARRAAQQAGKGNDGVEIRVMDRGRGIPPHEQPHIFDAFFRGSHAVAEQIHGTGLGLNLVKKTMEANGGTVVLESQPGSGSTFILTFPAQS